MPIEIKENKLLLVEGKDEEKFFEALFAHSQLLGIQVAGIAGKTQLASRLKALVQVHNFSQVSSLAIVRDADGNLDAAAKSVRSSLQGAGLAVPPSLGSRYGSNPTVAIFIMPDNVNVGMLEDLCLNSIAGRPELDCVDDLIRCLQDKNITLPPELSKARAHAYIATQQKPDLRVGEAAAAGYWPFGNSAFSSLKQFLNSCL